MESRIAALCALCMLLGSATSTAQDFGIAGRADRIPDIGRSAPLGATGDLGAPSRFALQTTGRLGDDVVPLGLPGGRVLMFYSVHQDDGTVPYRSLLLMSKSEDSGVTWSAPTELVSTSEDVIGNVQAVRTASGRIVLTWTRTFGELHVSISDDDGSTWIELGVLGIAFPYSLTATADGALWVVHPDDMDGSLLYLKSLDEGASWSATATLIASPQPHWQGAIAASDGSLLSLLYVASIDLPDPRYRDGFVHGLFQRTSTNGGQTWSAPVLLSSETESVSYSPFSATSFRPLVHGDGAMTIVYSTSQLEEGISWLGGTTFSPNGTWEVVSMQSTDQGRTWGPAEPFTRYAGSDETPVTTLVNDRPFVTWRSNRWMRDPQEWADAWYGVIGTTTDGNPPPTGRSLHYSLLVDQAQSAPVQFRAMDESGVAGAAAYYRTDGADRVGPFVLFDDGAHGDEAPGDGIWGGSMSILPIGQFAEGTVEVTDTDGNTVELVSANYLVAPFHTVGNVRLAVHPNGVLAGGDIATGSGGLGSWPREGGREYLFYGNVWVGAMVGGEKRFINAVRGYRSDFQPVEGTEVTIGQRLSDQDISLRFDDRRIPEDRTPRIGVSVHHESFQWSDPDRDDFIIVRYTVKNDGTFGDLTGVSVGLWLNTAVALDNHRFPGPDDQARYDAGRNLLVMSDYLDDPGTHIGLRWLGVGGPGVVRDLRNRDLETSAEYYDHMTTPTLPRAAKHNADYMFMASPPFDLSAGDSAVVAFGYVMGEGADAILANADRMAEVYATLPIATARESVRDERPDRFELEQNYPNPFNPETRFRFAIRNAGPVKVRVYGVSGQLVRTLANRNYEAGRHEVTWDGRNDAGREVATGVYVYTVESAGRTISRHMVKLK